MYWVSKNTDINSWAYGLIGIVTSCVAAYIFSFIFPVKKSIEGLTIYTMDKIKKLESNNE